MLACVPASVGSLAAALAALGAGEPRILIADRTSDVIWAVHDADGDGTISAAEVRPWFDASNAAGTLNTSSAASIAAHRTGRVAVADSDSARRNIYLFRDMNGDGDALDKGESSIAATPANFAGVLFTGPTGIAFDAAGRLIVSNSATSGGADAIYRLVDLDLDGRFEGENEIVEIVGVPAFGAISTTAWNPSQVVVIGEEGYMRNSTAGVTAGVYRFRDLDNNGRADDPGEFMPFWANSGENLSGVLPTAGTTLEADAARPGSLYAIILVSGADRLVRLTDVNGNGDAHQPGEALIVYENAASGFTPVSILSLRDGRVILADNGGDRLIMLRDLDGDSLFISEGEATVLFDNAVTPIVGAVQQIELLPCQGDWDLDLTVNSSDISAFLTDWLAAVTAGTIQADVTADGVTNSADISAFLTAWLAGVTGGC